LFTIRNLQHLAVIFFVWFVNFLRPSLWKRCLDLMTNSDYPNSFRYAIYFAPVLNSPWWHKGSAWLGRDASNGNAIEQPSLSDINATDFARFTQHPRRYGWHATLKAPFRLAPDFNYQDLRQTVEKLCADCPPFKLSPLGVKWMGDFLALQAPLATDQTHAIAQKCIVNTQKLAASLSEAEKAKRRRVGLNPSQENNLVRWGYPYVFEDFKFHLSLTGVMTGADKSQMRALKLAAETYFGNMPDCQFSALSIFSETKEGDNFRLVEQIPLSG
jgi:Protein of unknown function (DUF1045)